MQALANEVGLSGDEATAKQLLRQVLGRNGITGLQRASVGASLAYWEMLPSAAEEDVTDGRRRMQEAADFYRQQPGEFSKETLTWTYLSWATQELLVGNRQNAKHELEAAQLALNRLSPFNTDKPAYQNAYMAQARLIDGTSAGLPSQLTEDDTYAWYGTWSINEGSEQDTRNGILILAWNRLTSSVDARLDIFDHGSLLSRFAGSGSFFDPKTLRIDWSAVVRSTGNSVYPVQQTTGYSIGRLRAPSRVEITTYLLGEVAASGTGQKTVPALTSMPH